MRPRWFTGRMVNRYYCGLAIGRYGLFTLWFRPFQIQGPCRFFRVRD